MMNASIKRSQTTCMNGIFGKMRIEASKEQLPEQIENKNKILVSFHAFYHSQLVYFAYEYSEGSIFMIYSLPVYRVTFIIHKEI